MWGNRGERVPPRLDIRAALGGRGSNVMIMDADDGAGASWIVGRHVLYVS